MTSPAPPATTLRLEEQEFIDGLIRKNTGQPGLLLAILEAVQERHPNKYLPLETLEYIAARTGIPAAQIYSVATFYALFNLTPQGEHTVCICRGTACHTRGSRNLLERVKLQLGVRTGEEEGSADKLSVTTADRKFTIRTVACFGQCALAPVVEVDHEILSHVSERTLEREVNELRQPAEGGLR
jgi:NADH-quinone oxidoreductase subunit E